MIGTAELPTNEPEVTSPFLDDIKSFLDEVRVVVVPDGVSELRWKSYKGVCYNPTVYMSEAANNDEDRYAMNMIKSFTIWRGTNTKVTPR